MIDFDEYSNKLKISTKIVSLDLFLSKWCIIKETLDLDKHNMLMGEEFEKLTPIYDELAQFEVCELIDFLEIEKLYGR